MKKRRLAFVLVVIVLGAPLLLLLKPGPPPPPTTSGFLGFTNIATGPAALFAVTNYPDEAVFPRLCALAVQQGGSWNELPRPAGNWGPVQLTIGARPEAMFSLPVPETNHPVRVVVEIRTEPTGWRALAQRALVKMGRNPRQWLVWLPARYFTNETVVGGAVFESGTK